MQNVNTERNVNPCMADQRVNSEIKSKQENQRTKELLLANQHPQIKVERKTHGTTHKLRQTRAFNRNDCIILHWYWN